MNSIKKTLIIFFGIFLLSSAYTQTVYVCTGDYAYAFHRHSDCAGLGNCQDEIIETDISIAMDTLGRVYCCRCWNDVEGRCKDDYPDANLVAGLYFSEAMAYAVIGVVALSAVILSNDAYLYTFYSINNQGLSIINPNNVGYAFGFRKTFAHSALEYGGSYTPRINFSSVNIYGPEQKKGSEWGGHFNFVQQVFYNRTPYWLKTYIGPSINYFYDLGYGGILGVEMKIADRLKIDLRYELTTETNRILLGVILNYQKRYFWQKKRYQLFKN